METKRVWRREVSEKRGKQRVRTDFYAVELADGGRYLRKVANVSGDGLLIESPLGDERPGQTVELELPRLEDERPLRVQGEVVRVVDGRVGVHVTGAPLPVDALGGREAL
ncbi:MAG TPA: PilZ domain-containing protein [Polyangia bacterium]|nr:PilZ domain-containing protein [Polyangia bacterium]